MIIENRTITPFNDGYWSEDLYIIYGQTPLPEVYIDDIEGYVYKPMCTQYGIQLYYREGKI